jgi:hypothetical protein
MTSDPRPAAKPGLDIAAELAAQLRVDSIRASTSAGSGHPTSSMSAADLLAAIDFPLATAGQIGDLRDYDLDALVDARAGSVESGRFPGLATDVLVATDHGVKHKTRRLDRHPSDSTDVEA